jgi:3',5'-cyclic-AMP phosphodiesterase
MAESRSRRDVLLGACMTGLGIMLPSLAAADTRKRRSMRLAFFTDTHVSASGPSGSWLARALEHAQARRDKPDLIFFGGDMIMDANSRPWDSVSEQWKQFLAVTRGNLGAPVQHVLGNHDIWGWDRRSGATGKEPLYGKQWAMDLLKWNRTYRSFDMADWHFVVLDSTMRQGHGAIAKLDDEQFEWLSDDLRAHRGKKTAVVSHIPIVAACPMLFGTCGSDRGWHVPGWLLHVDGKRIKNLFAQNPQVKACLSGHIHLTDRVDYNGVSYLCNGAVCGAWWQGPHQETQPGYAMIDLFSDGTIERQYVPYGWKKEA